MIYIVQLSQCVQQTRTKLGCWRARIILIQFQAQSIMNGLMSIFFSAYDLPFQSTIRYTVPKDPQPRLSTIQQFFQYFIQRRNNLHNPNKKDKFFIVDVCKCLPQLQIYSLKLKAFCVLTYEKCLNQEYHQHDLFDSKLLQKINIITLSQTISNKQMSQFLKGQDFLPIMVKQNSNPHWSSLIQIVSDYDQLLQKQKGQINQCLEQTLNKRIQLIGKFLQYKDSLNYDGVPVKKETSFIRNQKLSQYFSNGINSYHEVIRQIICKLFSNPISFARLIKSYPGARRFVFTDFCQNLAFTIFPPYLPTSNQKLSVNITFLFQIIRNWDYSLELCRPDHYTPIDQVIQGYLKTPEIVSYVERISTKFLQKINQSKLDAFAFDEDAIKNELQVRKLTTMSYNPPKQKDSLWSRIKVWRKKTKDDHHFQQIQSPTLQKNLSDFDNGQKQKKQILQIMKKRQNPLISIISHTIDQILKEQPPLILCQMLGIFHLHLTQKIRSQNGYETENFTNNVTKGIQKMQRHYCYFLMTNFLLSQLHSKFTVSYQGSSRNMNHADLQNISQIWRIISFVFQGSLPSGEKYKYLVNTLKDYKAQVQSYYFKMLQRSSIQKYQKYLKDQIFGENSFDQQGSAQLIEEKMSEMQTLLNKYYQSTYILSFNDLKIIIDMLRFNSRICDSLKSSFISVSSQSSENIKKVNNFKSQEIRMTQEPIDLALQFDFSKQANQLYFLQEESVGTLFHSKGHATYKGIKYQPGNLLFVIRNQSPSNRQITLAYTGEDSPLKHLPLITNILINQSNLTVNQVLQVSQSLQVIKNLPINQLKYYLVKLSNRYSNLFIKDSSRIEKAFRDSLLGALRDNIQRKSLVLSSRDYFFKRMQYFSKLIDYFKSQLKNLQFYERISESFIRNTKIKVYLNIENNLFRIRTNLNDLKGFKVGSLMSGQIDTKSNKSNDDDFALRNSFKFCESIRDFLDIINKNSITNAALLKGRKVDQFNSFFIKFCEIVISQISNFLAKRTILKNLDEEKLAKVIVRKIQDEIFEAVCTKNNQKNERILDQDDSKLRNSQKKVNIQQFYKRDLQQFNLEKQFLVKQGISKFKLIIQSNSIQKKLGYFEQLFVLIFTIVGFSMAKNKISAQIINPIMQYILVKCPPMPHYQTLYALQSLKWRQTPQTNYNLTLYQSSLTYIQKRMPSDYPYSEQQH